MKFYIYWEGTKNKENYNIVQDDTVTTFDAEFFKDVAEELQKQFTPNTKIFGIAK